jgi:hypothetical protein
MESSAESSWLCGKDSLADKDLTGCGTQSGNPRLVNRTFVQVAGVVCADPRVEF